MGGGVGAGRGGSWGWDEVVLGIEVQRPGVVSLGVAWMVVSAKGDRMNTEMIGRSGGGVNKASQRKEKYSEGKWKIAVAREVEGLWRELIDVVDSDLDLIEWSERRADEMRRCGENVVVRECECCGKGRHGSGSVGAAHRTCKARVCVRCATVRALRAADYMEKVARELPKIVGYHWQHVVVTFRYDPEEGSADLTWKGLRERARAAVLISGKIWKIALKGYGAAMLRSVEMSMSGAVHLHALYYGPVVDPGGLTRLVNQLDERAGAAYVDDLCAGVKGFDPTHSAKVERSDAVIRKVRRVAQYVTKGVSTVVATTDEAWLAGEDQRGMYPAWLAARWELATRRQRLVERYGSLRGWEFDDNKDCEEREADRKADHGMVCMSCGAVGRWRDGIRSLRSWIKECHDAGERALIGGAWKVKGDVHECSHLHSSSG